MQVGVIYSFLIEGMNGLNEALVQMCSLMYSICGNYFSNKI